MPVIVEERVQGWLNSTITYSDTDFAKLKQCFKNGKYAHKVINENKIIFYRKYWGLNDVYVCYKVQEKGANKNGSVKTQRKDGGKQ